MVDFDSKEAKKLIKKDYKPRSVNGYIVYRKGNDSRGIGLKDTPEGWLAIHKLEEEVAKEITIRESRGKSAETPLSEQPKAELPPGSKPSDLKVAKSVTSPEKPQDATMDQHLKDATRDHAIESRLGNYVRFDVMHYCTIPDDARNDADKVLEAFKNWWSGNLLPLVKDSHALYRSNIALMLAEKRVTKLTADYLQKEKAYDGLNMQYQLLTQSTCEACKNRFILAMGAASMALKPNQEEVKTFQEKWK